jgi:hypothetical protein
VTKRIHMFWFGHQPFFVPDDELLWRVHSSYLPLLDALVDRHIPFTLGLSGGVLERIAKLAPEFLNQLKNFIGTGLVGVAGTAAHHPVMPWLSTPSARAHIEEDKRVRKDCGLPAARLFWPTELAWSMRIGKLVNDAGYQAIVVDSRCSDSANLMPTWRYIDNKLVPDTLNMERACRSHLLTLQLDEASAPLDLWVRDGELAHALVHILRGDEHDEDKQLGAFREALDLTRSKSADPNAPILLADDMERLLPDALARFLELLDDLLDHNVTFCTAEEFGAYRSRMISYVPAGTMEGGQSLWDLSVDDRWFREYLERVTQQLEALIDFRSPRDAKHRIVRDRLLRIQDSGFYFWRYVARSRRPFYDELFRLESWLERKEH